MDSILNWYREEGLDLQGRLGRRAEPVADPLEQGAALQRRDGLGPGVVHARRGCLRRDDQVRWRDPARGQDGRARRRSPRHRGVHRHQGARGGEDPRPARCRVRHGPRRQGHHLGPVPEREQLGAGLRRVHARRRGGPRVRPARARHRARSSRPSTRRRCSARMAEAAWACADPGIQYDDTINDWHTNPESGRITASNPCSEYMSLDNSSCNLASLNLLKFLKDDDSLRRGPVREVRRVHHHRDGHLHLLRGLPDRGDRRHHPQVPPAGHRLREPRRPADGDRPRLRLRRRSGAGGGDHQPDDRHRLPALRRAGLGGGSLRGLRPQQRRPHPGHAQALPPPPTRCARTRRWTATSSSWPGRSGRRASRSARCTAGATRRPPSWRRPAPSGS